MNDRNPYRRRGCRNRFRAESIDRHRDLRLVLGAIDRRIGRGRHNEIGLSTSDFANDRCRIAEIEFGTANGVDLDIARKPRALQKPPRDLAFASGHENPHRVPRAANPSLSPA